MRKQQIMKSEYEHILAMGDKLGEYTDEWIAVVDGKVVARGNDGKKIYDEAKKLYPDKRPFIMRVPTERIMVL